MSARRKKEEKSLKEHSARTDLRLKNRGTYQALSDEQLVDLYRSRDQGALGEIHRRYAPMLLGVCLKYMSSRAQAKDACAEVFEQLITKLKTHDVQALRPWLYVLCRNHCLMQLRKLKVRPDSIRADYHEAVADDFSLRLKEQKERRLNALEEVMALLPTAQRECVRLFYLDQRPYKEIAQTTDYSLKEVKSHIQNGKRQLKNLLMTRDEFRQA